MNDNELRDMIMQVRPQDVLAAMAGVSLRNTLRVLRAFRTLTDATAEDDISAKDYMMAVYDECESKSGIGSEFASFPDDEDVENCSVVLDLLREHEDELLEPLEDIKRSREW